MIGGSSPSGCIMENKDEILDDFVVIDLDDLDEEESSEFKQHKESTAECLNRQLIKKGWTPEMLAERVEYHVDYIRHIQQGHYSLSHKVASQLALALGCDISEVDPSRKGETAEIYKD